MYVLLEDKQKGKSGELIYLGFDPFLSMVYKYFTIYISMFSTLLGMFSGSSAFRSKAMTLEHFGA